MPRFDLVIVGAGPAGISAAYAAKKAGLDYVVLEKGEIAQTIRDYPLFRPLHSPAVDVELRWGELLTPENPTREEVLAHYEQFARDKHRLNIRTGEPVLNVQRAGKDFILETNRDRYVASHLVMATGGFGVVRKLNVPGECEARVSYRFSHGAAFRGKSVLVVGGGNSAAEAALHLSEDGAHVILSLRRPNFSPRDGVTDAFTSVKAFNIQKIEERRAQGIVKVLFSSQVVEVADNHALLQVDSQEEKTKIHCDHVFALLGADPDVSLLRQLGAEILADGRPRYDFHYQTSVPHLFVAGHMTRELHMANAVLMGAKIVRHIRGGADYRKVLSAASPLAQLATIARKKSSLARQLMYNVSIARDLVHAIRSAEAEPVPSTEIVKPIF